VRASLAENTRRAYLADLAHFEAWGGRIPATEEMLASYLAAHAGQLKTSTLTRRLAALSKAHAGSTVNPARSALVLATMRGIVRRHQESPRQAKPLVKEELVAVLDRIGGELRDVRDRALLLIGFAGAFRRSELVALDREDLDFRPEGVLIHIRRSKTDQSGFGRQVAIKAASGPHCPIAAVQGWLGHARIEGGPVFRRIDRDRRIFGRLSGEAVSLIVKARVAAAGLQPDGYSGHSLRSGFATSAAQMGLTAWDIRRQTGHASVNTLQGYVRDTDPFACRPTVL
jgi:integrase